MREITAFADVTSKKTQKQQQVLLGGICGLLAIARGTHDPSNSLLHFVENNNNAFGDFHSQKQGQKRKTNDHPDMFVIKVANIIDELIYSPYYSCQKNISPQSGLQPTLLLHTFS